jgi:hypothetical protein
MKLVTLLRLMPLSFIELTGLMAPLLVIKSLMSLYLFDR